MKMCTFPIASPSLSQNTHAHTHTCRDTHTNTQAWIHTNTDLLCICFVICAKLICAFHSQMTNARSWGWCRPPHVGFINYASMLTSRVTASIAQARRGGVRPCWTQMNRSDSSQIPCPTPWLAGRGGKMEHREESPFCVSICAETSRSPSQSVLSCEHVLPAGRCCHVSNLGARLPSKGSWQSHPGWGGHRRPALGAPAGFGSGEDTCFFLILLSSTLRKTDVFGCCCDVCILGYQGWYSGAPG